MLYTSTVTKKIFNLILLYVITHIQVVVTCLNVLYNPEIMRDVATCSHIFFDPITQPAPTSCSFASIGKPANSATVYDTVYIFCNGFFL